MAEERDELVNLLTDLKFWFETNNRTGSIMYPRICAVLGEPLTEAIPPDRVNFRAKGKRLRDEL